MKELVVSITRVGTNQKYSTGWDKAFGARKGASKSAAAKPAVKKASPKKKAAPKKKAKK
jgi:hypothetical protein